MSDFSIYRLRKGELTLQSIGIPPCEDWIAVRAAYVNRGRRTNEQLVAMLDGQIYAIERSDGNGFSMVAQDRQNAEDNHWYPPEKK